MQSEHPDAISRNLRISTEDISDLYSNRFARPDTRRFGAIFSLEVPEAIFTHCGDSTGEEHDIDSDGPSGWEFVAALDSEDTSSTQAELASNLDETSTLSAAERIVAGYRAIHGGDDVPECSRAEIKEKGLPDDQRSMYTLAAPTDTQSTMDMMWRPKPKIHMHRTYRRELMQAQSQAIAMMDNAGLKPTNKIQCRRRGCADILPNVEALKYHIHIHNIADAATWHDDAYSPSSPKSSTAECNTWKTLANHARSISSMDTRTRYTATCPPRKLSTGNLLPAFFPSRMNTSEAEHAPSLTTVARILVSDPNASNPAVPSRVRSHSEAARPSTHSRGRKRKNVSLSTEETECNSSTAMLLSSTSSSDKRCGLVLTPRTNSPVQLALNSTTNDEKDNCVPISDENAHPVPKKLKVSRSPIRVLSPTRALSPIRNGFKRILSFGCSAEFTDDK